MLLADNLEDGEVTDMLVTVPQIVLEIIRFMLRLVAVAALVMAERLLRPILQADGELHPREIGAAMAD
jgi:hypothetical protein